MNSRVILFVIMLIGVVALASYFTNLQTDSSASERSARAGASSRITLAAPLVAGDYLLVVPEQQPGEVVIVSLVQLADPGFVVIRDELFSEPGVIVGVSDILPTGESREVEIPTSRAATTDATLYAALYIDDGDGMFRQIDDAQVADADGRPAVTRFTMKSTASVPTDIRL